MNFILLLGTQWLKVQGACYLRTIILVNTEMEIFGLCIDSIIKNKIKINSTKINLMMTKRIKTLHFSTSTNVFATGKAHGDGPTKISLKQNDTLTHGDNVHANKLIFFKDYTREIQVMKNRISNLPFKNLQTQVQIVVSISLTLNSNPKSIVQNHTTHYKINPKMRKLDFKIPNIWI